MKKKKTAEILVNQEIADGIFLMLLKEASLVEEAQAGQFVNLYLPAKNLLLPRPISICEIDKEEETIKLVYAVVGKGTADLAKQKSGDKIQLMGPLGTGFMLDEKRSKSIIVGGGIGIPPLLELVKQLKGDISVYLGFRRNPILIDEFLKHTKQVYVATEDGSYGIKGNVMDLIKKYPPNGDMFYSCGPKPMLKALATWGKENNVNGQLSLEERMACGIGACLVCTCKITEGLQEKWENKRVCKDGPVFFRDEVIWDE